MTPTGPKDHETAVLTPLPSLHQVRALTGTAWILAAVTAVGVGLRSLVGPLHPAAYAVAAVCAAIFVSVPWLARRRVRARRVGLLLIVAFAALVLGAAYIVGGLDGPVLAVAPAVPLIATVLLGRRAGWVAAGVMVLGIVLLLLMGLAGHEFPARRLGVDGTRLARGIMVSTSCVLATLLVALYERQNERLREEIEAESVRDPLTGLANRRRLDETIIAECQRARRRGDDLSILLFDLDHFKSYNDTYGHLAGDRCLRRVARATDERFRRSGDLVARFGGEEFAVVLPATPLESARRLAEELREQIETLALEHAGAPLGRVTISAGVASADLPDRLVPRDLLTRADRALYRAKAAGRNRVAVADQL